VEPVRDFDADRYLGTWYEIARLDHRFERDLAEVTATYSKREDGGIAVRNRGYDVEAESWDSVEGRAYFTGEPDVGSLKVSFFGPFYGGYHVMALDEQAPDYGYALVSGPSTKYLWMLAREPELPEATIEMLVARAQDAGFPTDELIFVEHGVHGSAD
jgi:apolipoprotein D and lipocalin family protein